MLMVAIFEERQNREWGRYMESARRFWKIAHSYKPYRVAIKEMDMPENCLKCPFIDESGQYCQVDGKALVPNILCIDIEGVRENGCKNIGLLRANKNINTKSLRRLF